jgi:hypothetical protein
MQKVQIGALLLSLAVAMTATTAPAAPAKKGAGGRDKAISECIAEAKAQNPSQVLAGQAADPGSAGMIAYGTCMRKKGYRP